MRAYALLLLVAVVSAGGCEGPEDCSMLGECRGGRCVCDEGFRGEECDILDLAPAPVPGAVRRQNATWGGHPVLIKGRWHTFVSDVGPCGLHSFKSFSRIIHLSADSPEGPFEYEDVAVPAMAHNALPLITPQGELLIYYIGLPFNPHTLDCDTAAEAPINATSTINVAHSPSGSPSGPWTYHMNIMAGFCPDKAWCASVSNPAPYVFPNGTTLMNFHGRVTLTGSSGSKGAEAPGVAVGDSWKGPFRLANPDPIFEKPTVWFNITTGEKMPRAQFHGEDGFLWRGARAFHLVFHVKQPFSETSVDWASTGVLAWSRDGIDWTPCRHVAYNGTLHWATSPNPGPITSRQRPQLIFGNAASPHTPTHAYFGVQTCLKNSTGPADFSWNLVVPFNKH